MIETTCPHRNIIGDNYGETCADCGARIAGYGYWGSAPDCAHLFATRDDGSRVCVFCEIEETALENRNEETA